MEVRRHEATGAIVRKLRMHFHSALIADGVCHGAMLFDERTRELVPVYANAVVMAVGGQNALFGKTTGSVLCDGYAAGRLFMQGAVLKNLEFVQFHPTTLETDQKRMLVSEAARGEGGRLFFEDTGRRVYFMEDKFGPKGNLATRDVVSRTMHEMLPIELHNCRIGCLRGLPRGRLGGSGTTGCGRNTVERSSAMP